MQNNIGGGFANKLGKWLAYKLQKEKKKMILKLQAGDSVITFTSCTKYDELYFEEGKQIRELKRG